MWNYRPSTKGIPRGSRANNNPRCSTCGSRTYSTNNYMTEVGDWVCGDCDSIRAISDLAVVSCPDTYDSGDASEPVVIRVMLEATEYETVGPCMRPWLPRTDDLAEKIRGERWRCAACHANCPPWRIYSSSPWSRGGECWRCFSCYMNGRPVTESLQIADLSPHDLWKASYLKEYRRQQQQHGGYRPFTAKLLWKDVPPRLRLTETYLRSRYRSSIFLTENLRRVNEPICPAATPWFDHLMAPCGHRPLNGICPTHGTIPTVTQDERDMP